MVSDGYIIWINRSLYLILKIYKKYNTFCTGAYVPVTMEGNIMVEGVLASCYASSDHDLAHFAMRPILWFPSVIEYIVGDDTGFQIYSGINAQLGKWMLPNEQFSEY